MQITLNGNLYELVQRTTLHDLVNSLGLNQKNIAIAVNNDIMLAPRENVTL